MRIREIRKAKGLQQKVLARNLGIKPNRLSQYETGAREPDLDTLARIATALDVSVDDLMGRPETQKKPTPVTGDGLSALEWDLISIFRRIPPDEQERVIRIVQAASDSLRQLPEQLE